MSRSLGSKNKPLLFFIPNDGGIGSFKTLVATRLHSVTVKFLN
jgi:hypothetical protein